MSSRLMNHVRMLNEEITVLKGRIQPHDTGHIHTTISTLEDRVKEINQQIEDNKRMAYSEFDDEPIDAHDGWPKRWSTRGSKEDLLWVYKVFKIVIYWLDCVDTCNVF